MTQPIAIVIARIQYALQQGLISVGKLIEDQIIQSLFGILSAGHYKTLWSGCASQCLNNVHLR